MRLFLAVLTLILVFLQGAQAKPVGGGTTSNTLEGTEETDILVNQAELDNWKKMDGLVVHDVTVKGLVRTRLKAIQWLMRTKKDNPFLESTFFHDLQILFNTGNLYDLEGQVEKDESGGVHVTVNLKDKWTLFPALGGQQGGGSATYGGGLFDSNVLGYMVNSSILFWNFNGSTSYDINANQEYFAGTDQMWSLDWQDNIEAQTVHSYNGTALGLFAWRRQQKEIMLGTHLEGPWRVFFYASVFQDSVFLNSLNFSANVPYLGLQQRFYPKFIYGKVDWNNYQESGYEATAQPTVANVIGGGPQYLALELDFKRVWKVGAKERDNLAVYVSTSHMTSAGPNFLYQVGGYYNIRGYSDMREFGRDVAFTNLEWRPYLFRHRWDLFDLDLMVVQGCLFTDAGSAWGDSSLTGETQAAQFHMLWSAGAGLRINMVKFAGAILRLDWAQTLSPNEGVGFSLGIGQFF
jgi:outer membrane protein assembly factor BamA